MFFQKGLFKVLKGLIYSTPTPTSISYLWNFGSLLGLCLMIQILSGFFLAVHYKSSLSEAFDSVLNILEEVHLGWFMRSVHSNGASFFFIMIYFHIGRGLYMGNFVNSLVWILGIVIFLMLMGTAFLGYVLPWGQMSFWGATVITNLVSAIPYIGGDVVIWLWGGFSVGEPTLVRFFSIHFILPFVVLVLVMGHIFLLHEKGSSNILGVDQNSDKVFFHPFFVIKDLVGVLIFFLIYMTMVIIFSDQLMDPDNFTLANSLSTPAHIKPEWYFLFAYAILRSIPNKLGGVLALFLSIIILIPFAYHQKCKKSLLKNLVMISFFFTFLTLTWLGGAPVEFPYLVVSQVMSFLYFSLLIIYLHI